MNQTPTPTIDDLPRAGRHADAVQAASPALAAPGLSSAEQHALLDQSAGALCNLALVQTRQEYSAQAFQAAEHALQATGMDDYLTKPIRVDALVEALLQTKVRDDN